MVFVDMEIIPAKHSCLGSMKIQNQSKPIHTHAHSHPKDMHVHMHTHTHRETLVILLAFESSIGELQMSVQNDVEMVKSSHKTEPWCIATGSIFYACE